jgi:hypothetical protein
MAGQYLEIMLLTLQATFITQLEMHSMEDILLQRFLQQETLYGKNLLLMVLLTMNKDMALR